MNELKNTIRYPYSYTYLLREWGKHEHEHDHVYLLVRGKTQAGVQGRVSNFLEEKVEQYIMHIYNIYNAR